MRTENKTYPVDSPPFANVYLQQNVDWTFSMSACTRLALYDKALCHCLRRAVQVLFSTILYCFPIHLLFITAAFSSSTHPTRFKYNFNSSNVSTEHKQETRSSPINNNRSPSAKKKKKNYIS